MRGPQLIVGEGALDALADAVRALPARRVLVISDAGLAAAGWVERVRRLLEQEGIEVALFTAVGANPGDGEMRAGAQLAREARPEALIALGGGSCLDATKGIALVLAGGGRVTDYRGFGRAKGSLLPMIAVPTTAGTGSDAQSYAVLVDEESGRKLACGDPQLMFRTVILDPQTTASVPLPVVAAATLDALTHAVESLVSKRANPFSQVASREAFERLAGGADAAFAGHADAATRSSMQIGAFLAGRAIELSMLGAAHACANPLTHRFAIAHGVAVGLMIPHVIRLNAPAAEPLYRQLDPGGSAALAQRFETWLDRAGVARRLRDHSVAEENLAELAAEAATQWTGAFNPVGLDASGFEALYRSAW
jgi:alcohol dehydrogenase